MVFNGALKSNLTISGRQSTTEDGLMIQIDTEMMGKLKNALRSMKPFRIECSPLAPDDDHVITIEWIKESRFFNRRVRSLIDSRPLQGVRSLRLTNNYDFVNDTKAIRWNEIFLIKGSKKPTQNYKKLRIRFLNFYFLFLKLMKTRRREKEERVRSTTRISIWVDSPRRFPKPRALL